jgi:hypothetical protein
MQSTCPSKIGPVPRAISQGPTELLKTMRFEINELPRLAAIYSRSRFWDEQTAVSSTVLGRAADPPHVVMTRTRWRLGTTKGGSEVP